jgi:hypothetical protein
MGTLFIVLGAFYALALAVQVLCYMGSVKKQADLKELKTLGEAANYECCQA